MKVVFDLPHFLISSEFWSGVCVGVLLVWAVAVICSRYDA